MCTQPICHRRNSTAGRRCSRSRAATSSPGRSTTPPPPGICTIIGKFRPLAGAANPTTNWLLTEYPNAYLFGVITELAAVQRNAEMAQLYKARRDEAFAEIIQRYA